MSFAPTRAELARMFPRALPQWLDALHRLAPELNAHYRVDRARWVSLAGQIGWETRGLSLPSMTENMRFTTASRILEVYSYRLGLAVRNRTPIMGRTWSSKAALARALVAEPRWLAIAVYSGREGTPAGQGDRYIGRGPTQITHLDNYRAIAQEIRRQPGGDACPDLVAEPERLADDPDLGIRSCYADFQLKGLWRWADAGDVATVSDILNTGNAHDNVKPHGLDGRKRETAKAVAIWPPGVDRTPALAGAGDSRRAPASPEDATIAAQVLRNGSVGPDVEAAQRLLVARGYALGAVDGKFGDLTRRAVVAFQLEHALPTDGDLDAADMAVLEATAPLELPSRIGAETVPGSDQVAAGAAIKRTGGAAMFAGAVEISGDVMGVSPIGIASAYLEHVGGLLGKISGLGMSVPPKVVTLALLAVVGLTAWKWGATIIERRVEKYRSGLDLSR